MKWFWFALLVYAGAALAGPDQRLAAAKLRTYCKACHGVGELRFIRTEDDDELWQSLFKDMAPSKRPWAVAIREVLDWPSDTAPAFDDMIAFPDRDWMPKGAKRTAFAADKVGNFSTRRFILDQLCADPAGFCSF